VTGVDLSVDVTSPTPPYEQIRAQIAIHIHSGRLLDGARLPTMRALAADLGVAVGTVARAYRELEAAGLVASRRRTGTVVTSPPSAPTPPSSVQEAALELAHQAARAGLDGETTLAVLRSALATLRAQNQPG
jgi:GntR family transcriptional regulator